MLPWEALRWRKIMGLTLSLVTIRAESCELCTIEWAID